MSQEMTPGQNCKLDASRLEVSGGAGCSVDFCAFMLGANGKTREDGDFVFFGQPKNSCIELTESASSAIFNINLELVPEEIQSIQICVASEQPKSEDLNPLMLRVNGPDQEEIVCNVNTDQREEKALILGQIYRRNERWKFRFLDQGFKGGLRALAEYFGVEVEDEDAVGEPQVKAPPTNLKIFFSYGHDANAPLWNRSNLFWKNAIPAGTSGLIKTTFTRAKIGAPPSTRPSAIPM